MPVVAAAAVVALAFWLAPPDEPSAPASAASVSVGKRVFLTAGCVQCHTLSDANAVGDVGPNLDEAKPSRSLVINRVTNGQGAMPSFGSILSKQQIRQVADYVSSKAGD
jgi:mono/diheme cytochrome c family protein